MSKLHIHVHNVKLDDLATSADPEENEALRMLLEVAQTGQLTVHVHVENRDISLMSRKRLDRALNHVLPTARPDFSQPLDRPE